MSAGLPKVYKMLVVLAINTNPSRSDEQSVMENLVNPFSKSTPW